MKKKPAVMYATYADVYKIKLVQLYVDVVVTGILKQITWPFFILLKGTPSGYSCTIRIRG